MVPEREVGGAGGLVAGNLNGFNKLPLKCGKCVFAKKKREKSIPISLFYLALAVWANFHANLRGLGMNSGTVFKLCVYACRCCRSRQTQSTICNAAGCPDCLLHWESGSLQALLPNWARCCRGCLLTLTANNVLLDDCTLLNPERSQRLMKRSRKWRRMRDTDAGSLSM